MLDTEQMALVVMDRKDKTKVDKRRQDRQVYRQTGNSGSDLPMLDAEQMALVVVDRKDTEQSAPVHPAVQEPQPVSPRQFT